MGQTVMTFDGVPGTTTKFAMSADTVVTLSTIYNNSSGEPAIGAIITGEVGDIRFTLGGTDPVQGAAGTGHVLVSGQSLQLSSGPLVRGLKFRPHTSGGSATLQVTCLFERG
jgi:hypothetical protein